MFEDFGSYTYKCHTIALWQCENAANHLRSIPPCACVYLELQVLCLFNYTVHVLITLILFISISPLCTNTFGRCIESTTAMDVSQSHQKRNNSTNSHNSNNA
jgi:hypothetical protein